MLQDLDPCSFGLVHHCFHDHSHPMRQAQAWSSRLRLFKSTKSRHLLSKLLADDSPFQPCAGLMLISLNVIQMNL